MNGPFPPPPFSKKEVALIRGPCPLGFADLLLPRRGPAEGA